MFAKNSLQDTQFFLHDKLNRPLHDLRLSVIDRCNLRCPYCMPFESADNKYQFLESSQWLSFDDIEYIVRIFVNLGVGKLRITGGEPLLRPQLSTLIARLKLIKGLDEIALTTNGVLLASVVHELKQAGLDRLTISIDSLNEAVYHQMTGGRAKLSQVFNALDQAQQAGFESLKINCVVQRGVNDHTILEMINFFRGTQHVLRFIEYMDVGNRNHWNYAKVVPSNELIKKINQEYPLRLLEKNHLAETSQRYGYVDAQGEIGFVSSVTRAFCGDCNRLRLSSDGKMYTCLFSCQGIDIKQSIKKRSDSAGLIRLIKTMWNMRSDRYSQLRSNLRQERFKESKVEMFQIGG